jgi:DNA polymerase delta subunit 1
LLVDLQLRTDRVQGTCVELFGRASDGASVYVTVHGWYPYLYVPAPSGWLDTQGNKDCLRIALQEALGTALESQKAQDPTLQHAQRILYQFDNAIVQMELIVATDIMGFDTTKEQQLFLKIEVISQALIAPLRRLLETEQTLGMTADGVPTLVRKTRSTGTSTTYNSNLDPILQFMVDKQLSGCQWCRAQMIASSSSSSGNGCRSRCRYEVSCHVDELHLLSSEERSDLGPLRILSFDLEAAGRRGVFPDPGIDPVIQISIHMKQQQDRPLLSFKDCYAIEGARVMSYETEEAMLLAFRDIVVSFDPDILTGYNICNFDMEYLQKRAQALGIEDEFCTMTRVCPPPANHKKKKEDSRSVGAWCWTCTYGC